MPLAASKTLFLIDQIRAMSIYLDSVPENQRNTPFTRLKQLVDRAREKELELENKGRKFREQKLALQKLGKIGTELQAGTEFDEVDIVNEDETVDVEHEREARRQRRKLIADFENLLKKSPMALHDEIKDIPNFLETAFFQNTGVKEAMQALLVSVPAGAENFNKVG